MMEETWRWFGPQDVTTLADVRQTGARGIVTALHHVPYGEVWSVDEIEKRKAEIAGDSSLGFYWRVVESVPVAEELKLGGGPNLARLYENYRQTLREFFCLRNTHRLLQLYAGARLGAHTTRRTNAWRCNRTPVNMHEYAAFDCYMLERKEAELEFSEEVLQRARAWRDAATEADRKRVLDTIMAGLPGTFERYDIPGLRDVLRRYQCVTKADVRTMLVAFLKEIIPVAEECGIAMAIHPDDPPRPLFGLPHIVGSAEDIDFIINAVPSVSNGLTLCTGSLGARCRATTFRRSHDVSRHTSISHICEMLPRTRTGPSWKPSILAATLTWSL